MAEKELWKGGEKRLYSQEHRDIINKANGMELKQQTLGWLWWENILLIIAETVFPSGSKGTETPLDDVQGKNEIMHVRVLWKLWIVLHMWSVAMTLVTIPLRTGEQRTLETSHGPDKHSQYLKAMVCSTVVLAKVSHLFMYQQPQDTMKLWYHQKVVTPPAALRVHIHWLLKEVMFWLSCPS